MPASRSGTSCSAASVDERDRARARTNVRSSGLRRIAQVLDQREQRRLAVVERDEVDVVEHARLGQLAQLGVDVAAAEHDRASPARRALIARAIRNAP